MMALWHHREGSSKASPTRHPQYIIYFLSSKMTIAPNPCVKRSHTIPLGICRLLFSHQPKWGNSKTLQIVGQKEHNKDNLRATSHTRLRARDHYYTSSTLIGGKGGAGPSLLHPTLEGPTEYVNAR
jgi:hypothetical protein